MNSTFEPRTIEAAVQAAWAAQDVYRVTEDASRKKFYACSMLPYPSGKLHMGHVRNYTINDVMARYLRMQGYNVLMPMGWDAFGLPAENAAIANHVPPAQWTRANIADMKSQMQPLGLSIDWSREIATCDPSYYKWNQWLFLKMLEKGIAYRKTQVVNWDPVDQTVLANEQVIDGRGWRSGAVVEKKEIPGYYLAITQYAEELLSAVTNTQDAHYLKGWPERVRIMQENWIGKSEGVRFAFTHTITDAQGALIQGGKMHVFTTRADTIMGVTFCAVAPEHPLALRAGELNPALAGAIAALKQGSTTEAELATKDKEGVATGLFVTHPLTGQQIEVWVGNYVLMAYGDGAVMGVPAHDERDFAFAKQYGLPVVPVVALPGKTYSTAAWQEWYADKTAGVCVNSGPYDGLPFKQAVDAVAIDLAAKGLGEKKITYRLRDWGISRQRYWGTPIPIIHCPEHGAVPVPEKDLPVVLPEDLVPDGSGNPLNKHAAFHAGVQCPVCGQPSRRETDTMDTFVDSAWYIMRYACPDAATMVDARNDYWMPMDQYIGGIEHAVLHLLYARFWAKAMRDLGLIKFSEPFINLFTQGMLTHDCYYREEDGGKKRWFYPSEINIEHDDKGRPVRVTAKADGLPVLYGGTEKMSKSKNNVVEPRQFIAQFGADTARTFVMFAGPSDQSAAWSDSGAEGAYRFLRRLWNFAVDVQERVHNAAPAQLSDLKSSNAVRQLRRAIHATLQQAQFDYQRMQYNTVVSAAMKMLNALEEAKAQPGMDPVLLESLSILIRVLYPVAPHMTTQLWSDLGYEKTHGPLLDAPWPQVDTAALEQSEVTLAVQVNGKLRAEIVVPQGADDAAIGGAAMAHEQVRKFTDGLAAHVVKIVPGKLVSIVAK
jgi:leucyl-tRNA synthetase